MESLLIDPNLAGPDPLQLPEFVRRDIRANVLRLDRIHPIVSGNKWFKLTEHLRIAAEKKCRGIVTFGGPWSNHILALAFAAQTTGLRATGIIRGERPETLSATLQDAAGYGMQLEFIARNEYKKRNDPLFLSQLSASRPGEYILPEGAGGRPGIVGSEDILHWMGTGPYSHILCAIGTGTMFLGLARASDALQKIIGIPVLRTSYDLLQEEAIGRCETERTTRCEIIDGYHFGGYAHKTEELLLFMRRLYSDAAIPTDFVYTGKLFYAAVDLANKGFFPPGANIMIIHSGGLQGNRSLPPGTLDF